MKNLIVTFFILLIVPSIVSCARQNSKNNQQQSFQEFWSDFRSAVLADDKNKILSMTKFPFKTRGVSDDDPVVSHDKASFIRILPRLLDQDTGISVEPETMRDLIKRTIKVPKDKVNNDAWHRIGDICFENEKGIWSFTFAYFDG